MCHACVAQLQLANFIVFFALRVLLLASFRILSIRSSCFLDCSLVSNLVSNMSLSLVQLASIRFYLSTVKCLPIFLIFKKYWVIITSVKLIFTYLIVLLLWLLILLIGLSPMIPRQCIQWWAFLPKEGFIHPLFLSVLWLVFIFWLLHSE